MGQNKALLPFGGFETLAEFQYYKLYHSGLFSAVYFSLKEQFLPFKAPTIFDNSDTYAPIVALEQILAHTKTEKVFVIAVDVPFFDEAAIGKLLAHENAAVLARSPSGIHPLCAVYSVGLKTAFQNAIAINKLSIQKALDNSKTTYIDFDDKLLVNLNYYLEYCKAYSLAAPPSATG